MPDWQCREKRILRLVATFLMVLCLSFYGMPITPKISTSALAQDVAVSPSEDVAPTTENAVTESSLQSIPAVRIEATADPAEAAPGEALTVTVRVTAEEPLRETTFAATLPPGLRYEEGSSDEARYDAEHGILAWPPRDLTPDAPWGISFRLLVEESARDVNVLRLVVAAPGYEAPATATLALGRRFPPSEARITPAGGELVSPDGRLRLTFPPDAVRQAVRVAYRPLEARAIAVRDAGIAWRAELTAITDDAAATPVHRFETPLQVRVSLAGLVDPDGIAPHQYLYLTTWDEAQGTWETLFAQVQGEELVAELPHFSIIGGGVGEIQSTGWVLAFNDAKVSTFSGGLSYTYPLRLPSGRGGLAPDLDLDYNSRRVDGVLTWIQTDWVGLGWTLDTMSITRKVTPDYSLSGGKPAWWWADYVPWYNEFILHFKGVGYKLKPETSSPAGRYHTDDEQFLSIERRSPAGGDSSAPNTTGEYWVVRLRDGTEYRLGYNEDAEQVVGTRYYDGDAGDTCHWSGSNPPTTESCYAGKTQGRVAFRWQVDRVQDLRGNQVVYAYSEEEATCGAWRERAGYVNQIQYNNQPGGVWGTRITFSRQPRGSAYGVDDDVVCDSQYYYFYQDQFLRSIRVESWDGAQYSTAREYQLGYSERTVPPDQHNNHTRRLDSIVEYGLGGVSANHPLPSTTFTYGVYQNKGICYGGSCSTWEQESFRYERLTGINNGYGGTITLAYEQPSDEVGQHDYAYNYRVTQKTVSDGQSGGQALVYSYAALRADRCYDNNESYSCDSPAATAGGSLVGYRYVTETLQTVGGTTLSQTGHEFRLNTEASPDRTWGRELVSRQRDASGTELRQVRTTWTAEAMATAGCYFIHPTQSDEYTRSGSGLPVTPQKTIAYYYEPPRQGSVQYGNLTRTVEYVNGTAYRETRRQFFPNTTLWIVDKAGAEEVYDGAGSILQAKTLIYYDTVAPWGTPPTRGDVIQTKRLVTASPETWLVSRAVYASSVGYYRLIESYDGRDNLTRTGYDATWTYPVVVTDALGYATTYQYNRVLDAVTAVTGPNGAATTTTYEYDYWGRLTKVIRPGDSSTYPTLLFEYTDTSFPLRIVTKERITSGQAGTLPTMRFYNGLGQLVQENHGASDSSQMTLHQRTYNAQGQVVEEFTPYYTAFSWSYVAPNTAQPKTTSAYDALGRPSTVTRPDNTVVRTYYDGLRTLALDAKNHQRIEERDPLGRLVGVKEFTGTYASPNWSATPYATTSYGYNLLDLLTGVTDAASNVTTISYDLAGRKTAMSDRDMGAWSYAYDNTDNLIRQQDARGYVIFFYYDALNRLTGKDYCTSGCPSTPPPSPTLESSYTYDSTAGGNLGKGLRTGMSDTTSGSASWTYDARGRVTQESKVINGTGGGTFVTAWTYDARDQALTTTYPDGEVVTTSYTPLGLPNGLSGTLAGQFTNYSYVASTSYNALGLPTQRALGGGLTTRWGYWGLGGDWDTSPALGVSGYGRLWALRTTSPAAGPLQDARYSYDAAGNVTAVAQIKGQATGWPTSGFTFQDAFDSKNTTNWSWSSYQTVPYNDGGQNVVKSSGTGSSWGATFYRTSYSLTNGKGLQVRLKVDGTNTQAHVTVEANDATYRRFGVIAKDGKLVVEYVDGSNARYPAELLSSLQANTWYVVRLVVDDGSGFYAEAYQESSPTVRGSYHTWMPTGKSWRFHHWIWQGNAYLDDYREFSTAGLAWDPNDWLAYSYDDLDRLTGVAAQSGWQGYSGSYVYNTIGNVTSFEGLTYSYGDSAHKHAVTSKSGGTYAYDANGNMVTRNVGSNYTLTYDQENRLTGVSGAATASFQYNADGQRVKGTVGSTTTVYVGGHYEKSGSTIRKYYTLGGQRVAMRENGVVSWLLTDALGSTAVTANSSGSKAGELRYRAYGTTRYTWGTIPTTYRYTGQREEASLGLYYYNARWYDPALGRFIQPDTIVPEPGNPQTLNRYTYALNNPLTYIDRDGHIAVLVIVGAVILVTKVIDYGWTAWDSYQSLKVMNDPNASEGAKNEAAANLAMTVAFEALEPDDFLPVSLPLDDLARKGVVKLGREAGEEIAETAAQRITREAGERVAREGLAGSVEAAQAAAKKGDEILPGLFKYGSEPIESYQQHHLWPRKMGGPRNGWAVYAKAPHYASEGIQGRLNAYLRAKVGMSQRQMEAWGRQNPDVLLEYLREFYKGENLPFPY